MTSDAAGTVLLLLGLLAWALTFGPVLLLWWLPGHRESAVRTRLEPANPEGCRKPSVPAVSRQVVL